MQWSMKPIDRWLWPWLATRAQCNLVVIAVEVFCGGVAAVAMAMPDPAIAATVAVTMVVVGIIASAIAIGSRDRLERLETWTRTRMNEGPPEDIQ